VRRAALFLVWVLGTAAAVTLAIQGVHVVTDEVTQERPAPLSTTEVRHALTTTTTTEVEHEDEDEPGDDHGGERGSGSADTAVVDDRSGSSGGSGSDDSGSGSSGSGSDDSGSSGSGSGSDSGSGSGGPGSD
jgi:hypothetical protein